MLHMAGDDPFEDNPFGGLPFFGDLSKMFGQQGPVQWDLARQLAVQLATGGQSEHNVDPPQRVKVEELARVAELQVSALTGLEPTRGGRPVKVEVVTRSEWASVTLDAYRPLMERLASRLQSNPPDDAQGGPETQMLSGLFQFLNPMMTAMSAGSIAGHLASRALGSYDLPVPRDADRIDLVASNLNDFADEWSVPIDDVVLWVCIHDLTMHSVLSLPHVRERWMGLIESYIDGFHHDPMALGDRLSNLDMGAGNPMELAQNMQELFADPDTLLGALRSPEQDAVVPHLDAMLAALVGYVDHMVNTIGSRLIGSHDALSEAFRRRRVTAGAADRFVERLVGVDLRTDLVERGHSFVSGIAERAGEDGVRQLWESARTIPTPAEVDAPGLWLARLDVLD